MPEEKQPDWVGKVFVRKVKKRKHKNPLTLGKAIRRAIRKALEQTPPPRIVHFRFIVLPPK